MRQRRISVICFCCGKSSPAGLSPFAPRKQRLSRATFAERKATKHFPQQKLVWIVLLCLGFVPMKAAVQAKEELPAGYEDATQAAQPAPKTQPAKKAKTGSAINAIGNNLRKGRAEPVEVEPMPVAVEEEEPVGYADAPRAAAPAPAYQPVKKAIPRSAVAALSKTLQKKIDQRDLPQGYEDAPQAGGNAAVRRSKPAKRKSAIGAIAKAIGGDQPNADPQLAQMERQYRPQFKQLLAVELAFVRRACDLDSAQRQTAAKVGEQCLDSVLRQCVLAQREMQMGRQAETSIGPRNVLSEELANGLRESLRPEQIERYRRESAARTAARKRAVVAYMVARADQTLVLSAEQREKMTRELIDHYSDAWERSMPLWMHNVQFIPSIPDERVMPLLNAKQKAVWQGFPKNSYFSSHMDFMMVSGIGTIQDQP
jgi:hypothetical protein